MNTGGYQDLLDLELSEYAKATLHVINDLNIFESLQDLDKASSRLGLDRECLNRCLLVLASMGILNQISPTEFVVSRENREFLTQQGPFRIQSNANVCSIAPAISKIASGIYGNMRTSQDEFHRRWYEGKISYQEANSFLTQMHQHIMAPMLEQVRSGIFENVEKIVDAGGGSGALARAFSLFRSPQLTSPKVIVFDLPQICKSSAVMNSDLDSHLIQFHPSSFFSNNWPSADAYHFSNILHDWSESEVIYILKRAFEHLPINGRIFIHETLLDVPKPTPTSTVLLHLLIYTHNKGRKFKKSEIVRLLKTCGFENPNIVHRFQCYSTIVATKSVKSSEVQNL